jgi:glycine cleavage system H protein
MYFTPTHEWVRVDGGIGTVGISDHAQKELGDIVYVELPKVGQIIKAGEDVCVLESTKAAVDVSSPVSGQVIEVNEHLKQNPSLINQFPETDAWLYKLKLTNLSELDHLRSLH